jgi:triphosphoribosyl-dephospho-CoA synthase
VPDAEPLSIGMCAQLACILEATARKPGNVHRYADFADTTYLDFLLSAAAIAPVMDRAPGRPVGETVLEAVRATRRVVTRNTNLGIILLLAPLSAVQADEDLPAGLKRVLAGLDVHDSRLVYEAIRLAKPGGIGQVAEQDVADEPSLPLRDVMRLAADRDLVARQYINEFADVYEGVKTLRIEMRSLSRNLEIAIIQCQLDLLALFPDSLIARKLGRDFAEGVSQRVKELGFRGPPWYVQTGRQRFEEFDAWLRAEGNTRNPGTTADLVTACLFIALREGTIQVPLSPDAFNAYIFRKQ